MATDVEKLVVQVSADLKSFENAMAKATGITRSQLAQIKADATQAGTAGAAAFTGASQGVQRFGRDAQKVGQNIVNLRGQTANLGAQFQDIAVQLQGGTSPLTIALQQGTQISAVLGGAGAGGAVKALGAAFASIVSPVSLVTIGLIAAGGAAIQYFAGLLSDGEKSEKQLKEQAALIREMGKEWEGNFPALDGYIARMDELEKREKTRAAGEAVIEDIWAEPKRQIDEYAVSVNDLANKLIALNDTEAVARLQDAFAELQKKIDDQTASGEDAKAAQDALNNTMLAGTAEAVALSAQLGGLIGSLDGVAAASGRAGDQLASLLATSNLVNLSGLDKAADIYQERKLASDDVIKNEERLAGLSTAQLARENEINRLMEAGVLSREVAAATADKILAAENRRAEEARLAREAAAGGKSGGASKAATEAEREREAVVKLIEALQYEQSLIGLSALEKEKMNALRKAGAAATAEERAQIEAIVIASYAQTDALKASEEQLERLRGLSKQVLGGMFEDLRDGADAAEVFANALNRIGESLVTAGIDKAIDAMSKPGGTGGNFMSNILNAFVQHKGGMVGAPGTPTRAVSPAIFAGAPRYHNGGVAGLRPGEVPAILQKGERVIPRGEGGGGGAVAVDVFVRQDGNWDAAVMRTAGAVSAQVVKRMAPGVVANAGKRAG